MARKKEVIKEIVSRLDRPVYVKLADGKTIVLPPRGRVKVKQDLDQSPLPKGVFVIEKGAE